MFWLTRCCCKYSILNIGWNCLARNSSSKVVGAEANVGRVDKSSGGGSNGMGESTIDGGIWVSSISSVQKSGVSLSITLAIVAKMSIRSKSLGRGIKSLGDWVKTSAGAEWDTVGIWGISGIQESRVSLSLSLTLADVSISISSSTWDRDVGSVHTRSTLETNAISDMGGIGVAEELSLSRDGGHKGRCYSQKLHDDGTALIF